MPVFGQILGIEGTAWNLSAALFDRDLVALVSDPYKPAQGGIHPREAAQHHAAVMGGLIGTIVTDPEKITGVAFSQGPGLGPCLRTVATAARSLALALNVPLVGVNHCVAHVEIGRYATGCRDPIVLYASGANTQVIGYLNSRYRIFGETLDIGIGNAIDKFARSKNLPHPGGPIIESLAKGGSYIELPYTVKGMDLAFSGLMSAAKDSSAPLADVCHSLQETAFAMCVEVTERAMSLSGKSEVLLVGGVGANRRLQEMLRAMCDDRGAEFFVPEQKYLGDNGAMIAYTGKLMLESGVSLPIESSQINPSFRSDEVEVTWEHDLSPVRPDSRNRTDTSRRQGAEAIVTFRNRSVEKRRFPKSYRVPALDRRLITERTRVEARLIAAARKAGVPTPMIHDVTADTITMERVKGELLTTSLSPALSEAGRMVGKLHTAGIMHGDLTPGNIIVREPDQRCVLIDFGLAQITTEIEQRGVDIHVLFQTLDSTVPDSSVSLKNAFTEGYRETFSGAADVIRREHDIELRGRYL